MKIIFSVSISWLRISDKIFEPEYLLIVITIYAITSPMFLPKLVGSGIESLILI